MADILLTIDGDASGALDAAGQVTDAMSGLTDSVASTEAPMAEAGETASLLGQVTEGLHGKMRASGAIMSDFVAVSERAGGVIGALGAAADSVVSPIERVTHAVMVGEMAFPGWGGLIAGGLQGLMEIIPAGEKAKAAMTGVEAKAADAREITEAYAKDSTMVFTKTAGEAGISRQATIETIGSLITFSQQAESSSADASGTRAQASSMASELFAAIQASDEASQSATRTATQFDLLQASQATLMSRNMATIGSLNEVAEAAQRAGESFAEYQANLGTQSVSAAPANLWQSVPGMAGGGEVYAGRAYIVGEHHSELFVPREDGRIVPDYAKVPVSAGNTYVTYEMHNHAPVFGVNSAEDLDRRMREIVREVAQNQTYARGYLQTAS